MPLSPWQAKRQLAWLASQDEWVEAPGALVFSSGGFVSETLEGLFLGGSVLVDGPKAAGQTPNKGLAPFCRVHTDDIRWDRKLPGRIEALRIRMALVAGNWYSQGATSQTGYDSPGINQATGALRDTTDSAFGQGESQGRDCDELLSRMIEATGQQGFIDSLHGFQGMPSVAAAIRTVSGVQVLKRELTVDITDATGSNYYHAPTHVLATPGSSHHITVSWAAVPGRYDGIGYAVFRGTNPGDVAPAYGAGTTISALTTGLSVVDTGPSGSGHLYNYSVFALYAETPASYATNTVERVSSAATCSGTTT